MGILKNQKGLTLIELLTTIVILGIIFAIAIPVVGNIIDNAKKDAIIASAKQVAAAAKQYIATENPKFEVAWPTVQKCQLNLDDLTSAGYLDKLISPSNKNPYHSTSYITIYKYNDGRYVYCVQLISSRSNGTSGYRYFATAKNVDTYTRDDVLLKE
ncbi:type II secretion system protein [Aneurinibacillus danicus]|jgi:type IV pilus assembly protein PilA|uniref:Prepilin-type N-terminal cleavage/methylation domain-containing protein n=1 Tax=Aneurinibacillus danicus TaxID=267746 RepID=A0A511V5G6_9BACL|nr:type II secretion system protein [Aneurinibacillus danicus]GEN34170.1 hypothetical protein ADA01nite_16300 [Aneurinibacillus danicus]